MTAPPKQETFTTQQPDGTFITHTTTVREKYVDEEYTALGCGQGQIDDRYCLKPEGIIRIAQIVVGLIIVCLITSVYGPGPFKGILFGQTVLMIFDGIAMCFSFMLLIGFFFNLHSTHLNFFPWRAFDIVFSLVCAAFFFILGILEAYYTTGAWSNNCNDIGGDGIIHNGCRMIYEWGFAATPFDVSMQDVVESTSFASELLASNLSANASGSWSLFELIFDVEFANNSINEYNVTERWRTNSDEYFLVKREIILASGLLLLSVILIMFAIVSANAMNKREETLKRKWANIKARSQVARIESSSRESLFSAAILDISTLKIPPLMRGKNKGDRRKRQEENGSKGSSSYEDTATPTANSPFLDAIKRRVKSHFPKTKPPPVPPRNDETAVEFQSAVSTPATEFKTPVTSMPNTSSPSS